MRKTSVILQIFVLLGISLIAFSTSVLADSPDYTKIDLGSLGGGNTKAYSINNSDQIVGQSDLNSHAHHAFLWENGRMTDLGTLGGSNSIAWGINNHKQIVGESQIASDSATHAFLWENGQMKDIGIISKDQYTGLEVPQNLIGASEATHTDIGFNTVAYGINNNGEIVGKGYIDTEYGVDSQGNILKYYNAFLWKNGQIIDLEKNMTNLGTDHYTDAAIGSYADAINDSDQVVGSMTFPVSPGPDSLYINNQPQEAFLWNNGPVTTLGFAASSKVDATDINNSGQITITNGDTGYPGGFVREYIWPSSNPSNSCGTSGDDQGEASEIMSINNSGAIFGAKSNFGGPAIGQGYFICHNRIGTDLGTYPNQENTILSGLFIHGGINDNEDAVADNLFFKLNQANPSSSPTPVPSSNPIPTPQPYNNGYNNGYNSNYNNDWKAQTGLGMFFNTNYNSNYNNGWNNNYNNGWKAPF